VIFRIIAPGTPACHGPLENIKAHYGMADLEVKYLWELAADTLVLASASA
jgi:hypothetical protein